MLGSRARSALGTMAIFMVFAMFWRSLQADYSMSTQVMVGSVTIVILLLFPDRLDSATEFIVALNDLLTGRRNNGE